MSISYLKSIFNLVKIYQTRTKLKWLFLCPSFKETSDNFFHNLYASTLLAFYHPKQFNCIHASCRYMKNALFTKPTCILIVYLWYYRLGFLGTGIPRLCDTINIYFMEARTAYRSAQQIPVRWSNKYLVWTLNTRVFCCVIYNKGNTVSSIFAWGQGESSKCRACKTTQIRWHRSTKPKWKEVVYSVLCL